ncbi:MAG: M23 family metallopeptidase [Vicinamibacterales bacterium]
MLRSRHRLVACLLGLWAIAITAPTLRAQTLTVATEARAFQPGELVLFRVSAPDGVSAVSVDAFDRTVTAEQRPDLRSSPSPVWVALVGIDLDVRPGAVTAIVTADTAAGPISTSVPIVVRRKAFPTRRLRVNPALVDPPPEALARIKAEVARVRDIYGAPAPTALWQLPFVRPVADPANSRFGSRSIFNGRRGSPHAGADFLSATGTPIRAPSGGRVRLAADQYFSGNTVILDHGLGLFSIFAHLSAFEVAEGDMVAPGQVIGRVGATGRVTGPHLHWGVRASGARVDPLSLLSVLGDAAGTAARGPSAVAPTAAR